MERSWAVSSLLERVEEEKLSNDLHLSYNRGNKEQFIQLLSIAALRPYLTDEIVVLFEPEIVEISANWLSSTDLYAVCVAFAKALPYAQYLQTRVITFLENALGDGNFFDFLEKTPESSFSSEGTICCLLLAIIRLLRFDDATFRKFVLPSRVLNLFSHPQECVKFLAVQLLALYLHAADAATDSIVQDTVGNYGVLGHWEGLQIDYRFLNLWEEMRNELLSRRLVSVKAMNLEQNFEERHARIARESLSTSELTVDVYGVLFPRKSSAQESSPRAVLTTATPTTAYNCRQIALALLNNSLLIVAGPTGSGKNFLLKHVAYHLQRPEELITLHLNESSDVKSLIGFYTSESLEMGLTWKPGVLTNAMRNGSWLIIEDVEVARAEALSLLISVIQNRVLFIPSTGETVSASPSFKIVGVARSEALIDSNFTLKSSGDEPWKKVHLTPLLRSEYKLIVSEDFPIIRPLANQLIDTYFHLKSYEGGDMCQATNKSVFERALRPKDMLKLCRRISTSMKEKLLNTEDGLDNVFLDAVDIYTAFIIDKEARKIMVSIIAEHIHIDARRSNYLLKEREIGFVGDESRQSVLSAGRISIPKNGATSNYRLFRRYRNYALSRQNLMLLERILAAVSSSEPVLIVGETGIGKTTSVQYLAEILGCKLSVINLSQQTEPADLIGGLKPIDVRQLVISINNEFHELLLSAFPYENNSRFYNLLSSSIAKSQWKRVLAIWKEALKLFSASASRKDSKGLPQCNASFSRKKRRIDDPVSAASECTWQAFEEKLSHLESRIMLEPNKQVFGFVEGLLVKAMKKGDWLLLDEINLASSETLECIGSLIKSISEPLPSLCLQESGGATQVRVHPDFRLFAAMNPAIEVGRTNLASNLRSCFTEIYFESPDKDWESLRHIVDKYLCNTSLSQNFLTPVISLYLKIKAMSSENHLLNGIGRKPTYSLRTLIRALVFVQDLSQYCSPRRAFYEGFKLGFSNSLQKSSSDMLEQIIVDYIFGEESIKIEELGKALHSPGNAQDWVREEGFWLMKGSFELPCTTRYVVTPHIRKNLSDLCRAVSARHFPVLIEGPTATGKTSMIEYLATVTCHKIIRINNHEHTDIQEYLGRYVQTENGKLQFEEGLLIQALRFGHWIILDELNLAPSEVLEALNRLLDDNRELLVPETQETVKPHSHFMLFATQNPAGKYGGRKTLSSPFRDRFVELYFDDIPLEELVIILFQRTRRPKSWCERIAAVYRELGKLRNADHIFDLSSVATLRDLFRWAFRKAASIDELASNGYMLLAERARKTEERDCIKSVIERVFSDHGPRVFIDQITMYNEQFSSQFDQISQVLSQGRVVWTAAMKRIYVLVWKALQNNEPVLLVGETGSGKTTICETFAKIRDKNLFTVNAHQNTESSDLIGSQRPVRNKQSITWKLGRDAKEILRLIHYETNDLGEALTVIDALSETALKSLPRELLNSLTMERSKLRKLFEWVDGSLIQAMKQGQFFLLDEISLADDSVLERLNSLLEPDGNLLLAEKGKEEALVKRTSGFQFFATMNPGGDYGKRELSPALRNRFTEIWVPSTALPGDLLQITQSMLHNKDASVACSMVKFAHWFTERYCFVRSHSLSIRDIATWATFINRTSFVDIASPFVHGAALVFIDSVGAQPGTGLQTESRNTSVERQTCLRELSIIINREIPAIYDMHYSIDISPSALTIGPFSVERKSSKPIQEQMKQFSMQAPTVKFNAMRVIRALQIDKPILLEGDPGVGKTALIDALATLTGNSLIRINLSEQTDITDLLGSESPAEGEEIGSFNWKDAPVLRAMKFGHWVLLDEINLASQSILEGLNSCIDHRGECYVPELDRTFPRHSQFRLFATQNPHHQGYGRKGLPQAFINRFTVVYIDPYTANDQLMICKGLFPKFPEADLTRMITFSSKVGELLSKKGSSSIKGGPWDFNLRDILRWVSLLIFKEGTRNYNLGHYLKSLFLYRFHDRSDIDDVIKIFRKEFPEVSLTASCIINISRTNFQIGRACFPRNLRTESLNYLQNPIGEKQELSLYESMLLAVEMVWPVLLVGQPGSGKSTMINSVASLAGAKVVTIPLNHDVDISDLIGGLEQVDYNRDIRLLLSKLFERLQYCCINQLVKNRSTYLFTKYLDTLNHVDIMHTDVDNINHEHLNEILEDACAFFADSDLKKLFTLFLEASKLKSTSSGVKFQWVDGPLIRAVEEGNWIVLKDANTCNSSVLDRLNSLLENDRSFNLNENCFKDGSPRIIKPHPNFRIFMTSCPDNGHLSRAIRNRSVEIYLPSTQRDAEDLLSLSEHRISLKQSSIFRFRKLKKLCEAYMNNFLCRSPVDYGTAQLSYEDLTLLQSFRNQLSVGLLGFVDHKRLNDILSDIDTYGLFHMKWDWNRVNNRLFQNIDEVSEDDKSNFNKNTLQIIHPRGNMDLAVILQKDTTYLEAYGALYDLWMDSVGLSKKLQFEQGVENKAEYHNSDSDVIQSSTDSRSREIPQILLRYIWDRTHFVFNRFVLPSGYVHYLRNVLDLCLDIYQLQRLGYLDESMLRAVVMLLRERFSDMICVERADSLDCWKLLEQIELALNLPKLKTGQSMQRMWYYFQGLAYTDILQIQFVSRLEELSEQFDNLKWSQRSLEIGKLLSVQEAFITAFACLGGSKNAYDASLTHINLAILNLEKVSKICFKIKPYFATDFKIIYTNFRLTCADDVSSPRHFFNVLQLLGDFHTRLLFPMYEALPTSSALKDVSSYFIDHECVLKDVIDQQWLIQLLSKIENLGNMKLENCEWLQEEIKALALSMMSFQQLPKEDRIKELAASMKNLLCAILNLHQDYFEKVTFRGLHGVESLSHAEEGLWHFKFKQDAQKNDYFQHICKKLLYHTVDFFCGSPKAEAQRLKALGRAWAYLGAACLLLYTPNVPVDPALLPLLKKQFYVRTKLRYEQKLYDLSQAEQRVLHVNDSRHCQSVRDIINALGPEPKARQIYRPENDGLKSLEGIYTLVLQILDRFEQYCTPSSNYVCDPVLIDNIQVVSARISTLSNMFQDIKLPLMGFLQCVSLGSHLASYSPPQNVVLNYTSAILQQIPLLASDPEMWLLNNKSFQALDEQGSSQMVTIALKSLALRMNSFEPTRCPAWVRESSLQSYDRSYNYWNILLREEQQQQKEKESINSLYHFKSKESNGNNNAFEANKVNMGMEDSNEISKQEHFKEPSEELCLKLADTHCDMFLEKSSLDLILKSLIREAVDKITQTSPSTSSSAIMNCGEGLRILILLSLQSMERPGNDYSSPVRNYDFYVDPNMSEAPKLQKILKSIQLFFLTEQHRQPEDPNVLAIAEVCQQALAIRTKSPLSIFLHVSERLYFALNEWQRLHMKDTQEISSDLADLIFSWRRLEIASWKTVLKSEDQKCSIDAKLWWFVLYKNVILGTSEATENGSVQEYLTELLTVLEDFLLSASFGQYAQRLIMLKAFSEHLFLLAETKKAVFKVYESITNLVDYFARYESLIQNSISIIRNKLAEDINEVVQIATLKSLDVKTLKEYALTSRRKVTKLARRYREYLNQPAKSLSLRIAPQSTIENIGMKLPEKHISRNYEFLHACENTVPGWQQRKTPYRDVVSTVGIMRLLLDTNSVIVQSTNKVISVRLSDQAYVKDIEGVGIKRDSLDVTKHLKQRKRHLFTVMKRNLRDLGFGHRIKPDIRRSQKSTLDILNGLPPISKVTFGTEPLAREYFYGVLEEMPNVRNTPLEHTENLLNTEVLQVVEHIEGLLSFTIKQRKRLMVSLTSFLNVEAIILKLQPFIVGDDVTVQIPGISVAKVDSLRTTLKMLPALLKLSVEILRAKNQFSGIDISDIESSMVSWQINFQLAYEKISSMHLYIYGLSSEKGKEVHDKIEASFLLFVEDLQRWQQSCPFLNDIIDRIISWTMKYRNAETQINRSSKFDARSISQIFFDVLDSMLGSVQDVRSHIAGEDVSLEAQGWLQSAEKAATRALDALKPDIIRQRLMKITEHESSANQPDLKYATCVNGLLKSLGPIIEQYRQIITFFISQYIDFHASICQYNYFVVTTFTKICSEDFWKNDESVGEMILDETKGDKIGLGDGTGTENTGDTINDSNDVNNLDHLENQDNPPDFMAEEGARDLNEEDALSDVSNNFTQDTAFEEEANGQKQDLEEHLEEAGPSAIDEKMWDKTNMEEDSRAKSGQGLTTGSAAAQEVSENTNEPQQCQDKQELEQQAGAELEPAELNVQGAEEGNLLDDQQNVDANQEQNDFGSPMDQPDLVDNEKSEGAFADYSKIQSPSVHSIDEPSDMENSLLSLSDLSETNSAVNSGDCNENDPLTEGNSSEQEKEYEPRSGNYRNQSAGHDEDTAIEPSLNKVGSDGQTAIRQTARGTEVSYEAGKEQSTLKDDHGLQDKSGSGFSKELGNMVDVPALQNSTGTKLSIWKSVGFELEEWMRRKIDDAHGRLVEKQHKNIEIGKMPVCDDDSCSDVQMSLRAEECASFGAPNDNEPTKQMYSPEDFVEDSFDEEKVTSNQEEPSVHNALSSQKVRENTSERIGDTITPETDNRMILDEPLMSNINRTLPSRQILQYDNSHLNQSKDVDQIEIDENLSQSLAQSLAEQLRLVLEPTKSTKFRGDFRTGKRLNIRRIIPYIASDGKKDKIWMRRTVPSRRAYQIMLALDDSKSMVESNSVSPALQSLILVAKALTLVEAGELCIVAFGENSHIALDFGAPFHYEQQLSVRKKFTFEQSKTDIHALLQTTLSHFRKARSKLSSSESHLWQLQLIISDGICEDHAAIRQLLHQAEQERIMVVFIIMDFGAQASQLNKDASQQSILDLQTVTFASDVEDNMAVRRQHYMDTFPFKWYLLVRNIEELPFVLATALRQWFAEVASYSS